jgi:hypothetical protein
MIEAVKGPGPLPQRTRRDGYLSARSTEAGIPPMQDVWPDHHWVNRDSTQLRMGVNARLLPRNVRDRARVFQGR